ncbi:MAG: hypothetical protein FIB06_06770 [Betaproteobacteria bacterium]|nr:hypothetical protein [Betaproteobacteria bacterium]
MLLVIAPDWGASAGVLQYFARPPGPAPWRPVGTPIPVILGRSGLAPAACLPGDNAGAPPLKREGDGCSPAGIFPITALFGYAPESERAARSGHLPYLRATPDLKCIDDPASRHYNRIIDQRAVGDIDWSSCEDMLRRDDRYELGAVVGYNCDPVLPGPGSCIFLHVWAGEGVPTAGCTAMALADVARVAEWLDGARSPVLVQLPRAAYERLRGPWRLPDFPA